MYLVLAPVRINPRPSPPVCEGGTATARSSPSSHPSAMAITHEPELCERNEGASKDLQIRSELIYQQCSCGQKSQNKQGNIEH
jgi:hypothetical protein